MIEPLRILPCFLLISACALTACKPSETLPAEPPAALAASAAAAAPQSFDVGTVPVSTVLLPPFPFIALPKGATGTRQEEQAFDRVYVIAGQELRPVEGRMSRRYFALDVANLSTLAAYRNYDTLIKSLGGVQVNTVQPGDKSFIRKNGGARKAILEKLRLENLEDKLPNDVPTFAQYVIRTPSTTIWVAFSIADSDKQVGLLVLEEQALQQTVGVVTADDMATALQQDGHIAVNINFDADSDVIRPESLPAVDEIVKLLEADKDLKLTIEGHTDTTGDAEHNRVLSMTRAQSVVNALADHRISGRRLSAAGKGGDVPIADNGTVAGRAKNRRIELVRGG